MSIQELSKSLVGDVKSVLEGKKLDPVGKADADIDNDGDTDSSDEYLHKRRAAIKKAMKDEGNKFTGCLLYTSPSPRDLSTSRMPSSA